MKWIPIAAAAAFVVAGVAHAQKAPPASAQAQAQASARFPPKDTTERSETPDVRAEPRYAALELRVGFEPDPREVTVDAGGNRDARAMRANCSGMIDFSRPDVNLTYTQGTGQFPLYIGAVSQADTTIVINDPQGNWHCNDDYEGLNPGVVFQRPMFGTYNIWIGTLDRGPTQPATVRISEVPPRPR
jgi:hypothetical protein